uniref:Uncharacterized protein n=1 Tax=Zea mays TaxID=4577 RepID=B6UEU4_MAIZE|nr:hypothetical protein [Zea mays]
MNCFVNLGLNSNSNHYVACLLIFLLHFSPQLNPSNSNSTSNCEGEEQSCTDGEQHIR